MLTKICKLCKHGYPLCTNEGMVCWCYLSALHAPVKKDCYDTCPDWEPEPTLNDEDEDEE